MIAEIDVNLGRRHSPTLMDRPDICGSPTCSDVDGRNWFISSSSTSVTSAAGSISPGHSSSTIRWSQSPRSSAHRLCSAEMAFPALISQHPVLEGRLMDGPSQGEVSQFQQ